MRTAAYDDKLLAQAFDLYSEAYCRTLPAKEDLQHITFSPAFERRMEKLLRRQSNPYYVLFNTAGKRVASLLLAILVGAAVTTFSVKALREPFLRFVTEVFETFTGIFFKEEPDTDPFVFVKEEPRYIPEGYTVKETMEGNSLYQVTYYNQNCLYVFYFQFKKEYMTMGFDTESTEYQTIPIGEWDGVLYTNKDEHVLMFSNEEYAFSFNASLSLPVEELVRMAESVAEK